MTENVKVWTGNQMAQYFNSKPRCKTSSLYFVSPLTAVLDHLLLDVVSLSETSSWSSSPEPMTNALIMYAHGKQANGAKINWSAKTLVATVEKDASFPNQAGNKCPYKNS